MKTQIFKISLVISLVSIILSCNKDNTTEIRQPEFIMTSLSNTLSVDAGEEFELFVPDNEEGVLYVWTVPDMLGILEGQGTNKIKVISTVDQGIIPVKSIGVTAERAGNKSYTRWLYREFTILAPPPTLENYRTKRYGAKTWMIENLNEAGDFGNLGALYADDPRAEIYGRYYTWHEAVTGIPNATAADHNYVWGASGIDDAGNPYVLDGTATNAFNIQIQGVCPDGWHIANMNDYYDLLVAIKEEYNVPGNSITQIRQIKEGYVIPWAREEGFKASVAMGSWGLIGPYLKGSSLLSDGGLWGGTSVKEYSYSSWGVFPLFVSLSDQIGFNLLPSGRFNGSKWENEGTTATGIPYSYNLVAHLKEDDRPFNVIIGGTNANFSNGTVPLNYRLCLRCVANY